jgi:hypothetical protein
MEVATKYADHSRPTINVGELEALQQESQSQIPAMHHEERIVPEKRSQQDESHSNAFTVSQTKLVK